VDIKYKVIKKFISKEMAQHLALEMKLYRDASEDDPNLHSEYFSNPAIILGKQFRFWFPWGGEALLSQKKQHISELFCKKLFPTYSYGRIYYFGSEMKKHTDRPSCDYSVTVCLRKQKDYPIYMDGEAIELEEGDACIYRGCEVEHWREKCQSREHIQLFMHYVEESNIKYHYDGRKRLGHLPPKNYRREDVL